jgi:hypothetical protein
LTSAPKSKKFWRTGRLGVNALLKMGWGDDGDHFYESPSLVNSKKSKISGTVSFIRRREPLFGPREQRRWLAGSPEGGNERLVAGMEAAKS